MNEITSESMRKNVLALEHALLEEGDFIEAPVRHFFSQGVYGREITIPKGAIIVGKIHKYSQLNIMSKGDLSVLTENGIERVKAPFTIVSPPGTKRAAYAHEETVWTTIHGTHETDLEKLEAHFIAQNFDEYQLFCDAKLIEEK